MNIASTLGGIAAVALALMGCSAEVTDEAPAGTAEQAAVVGCKIEVNNIDWVVDGPSSGHTSYQLKNVGNQACTYHVQSEVIKTSGSVWGPVRGPYSFTAAPSVAPYRTDNFSVGLPCRFTIWAKYRKGLDMTVKWHNLIPPTPTDPSGLLCE